VAYFNVAHLVRRGGVFCFRMAVLRSMWGQFGLREIKGSLKTGDPFTARIRCRKLSNAFEHLIDKARTMPDLTQDAIKALIQSYFQRCLDNSEEIACLVPIDVELDIGFEVSEMQAEAQRLGKALRRVATIHSPKWKRGRCWGRSACLKPRSMLSSLMHSAKACYAPGLRIGAS